MKRGVLATRNMTSKAKKRQFGYICQLRPCFGAGGIGYIRDGAGVSIFFHCREVFNGEYSSLALGMAVSFILVRARSAMGAGPQARDVRRVNQLTQVDCKRPALNRESSEDVAEDKPKSVSTIMSHSRTTSSACARQTRRR